MLDNEFSSIEKKRNRRRKLTPKRKQKIYCPCDRNQIPPGGKCDVCGFRDSRKYLKNKGLYD